MYDEIKEDLQHRINKAFESWAVGNISKAKRQAGAIIQDCEHFWEKDHVPKDLIMPYYDQGKRLHSSLMRGETL